MWAARFAAHFAGDRAAGRIFLGAGVRRRHAAVNPMAEDVSGWSTGARMRRYRAEALPLGKDAVGAALADAGLRAEDIGQFTVASCTGYATPGLDIRIAADLGMAAGLQRLVVGHMGCYAALPGLGVGHRLRGEPAAPGRPAVLRAHLAARAAAHGRPRHRWSSHALFGDAAAAVVVVPERPTGRPALRVVDVAALTDATTADHMTWDVTDLGFRMGLSPEVPRVLARQVRGLVTELLARHDTHDRRRRRVGRASRRAAHPGHRRRPARPAARRTGRLTQPCSPSGATARRPPCCSCSKRCARRDARVPGRPAVVMAFGPGLTLYAALLHGA